MPRTRVNFARVFTETRVDVAVFAAVPEDVEAFLFCVSPEVELSMWNAPVNRR